MFAISIDTTGLQIFVDRLLSAQNPAEVMVQLFVSGGWIAFTYVFFWGFWHVWLDTRQTRWLTSQKWTLLALDVPKDTEQVPKAVEGIFALLHGSLSGIDTIEKYWIGKMQARFSLEIVSNGGYVQFFVRTISKYRDLVESAIYAQYPDAEIAEVEDYVTSSPKQFPATGWDMFGTELTLMNKGCFPIRTYTAFEHNLSEFYFKDPISPLLEGMAKLRLGEQLWIQILISPNDGKDFRKKSGKIVQKLVGAKVKVKKGMLDNFWGLTHVLIDQVIPPAEKAKKKDEPPTLMQHLTPGEKTVIENIQMKLAKVVFKTKIRIIYVSKTEVSSKPRTVAMVKGVFGQFTILDSNGFKIYGNVTTKADHFWQIHKIFDYISLFMVRTVTTRQNSILRAYRSRSMGTGAPACIMNIEELATVFHFPMVNTKAPLLKKTEAKRAEAPFTLPVAPHETEIPMPRPPTPTVATNTRRGYPPPSLPEAPVSRVAPLGPTPKHADDSPRETPSNLPFV